MKRLAIPAGLFVVNFCSLVFEVVASRKAATYLGATAYANSALLAAFLAGIGLGGWMASWPGFSPAARPRWCGLLLLLAALTSAALAPALTWLGQAGPSGLLRRGILLAALIVPVGAAIGYSYPVMTALYARSGPLGRSVAATYAADTLGAAAGALGAGFLLVPALGLRATGVVSGVGLATIGALLLVRKNSSPIQPPKTRAKESPAPAARARLVLSLFFATGLAALSLEVAWIRLFTLVVGTSLFSFAITVAAFLAALGIGSQLMRARVDRFSDPAAALSRAMILTGASAPVLLLLSPVWERLYLAAYHAADRVAVFETAVFGLGLVSVLLPAGLMGAGFSLGVRLLPAEGADPARAIGRLYGLNTLGGVLGALLAGLLLMPAIGVAGTILLSAAVYLVAGTILSLWAAGAASQKLTHALTATVCGILALVWTLPEPQMSYAPYYHGLRQESFEKFSQARAKERLLYRRFSPYGLVTASEDDAYRYLRHNGRSEASTAPADMSTQLLIAHLPMLLHPAPSRVLNIGLGAGFTLGAIEQHVEPTRIVQAELDPRIVEAARTQFADVAGNALSDPRLVVRVTDGRKLLTEDTSLYDVIVSEPSHLWVSGVSGLFTTEFYRIVGARLAPGGIFATWVPRYEMGEADIQIVAATLLDEFPHVSAFENGPADIIFLASKAEFRPALPRIAAALDSPGIHADIARAMQGFPLSPENLTDLLEQVAANAELMPASVTAETSRNTDDWPVLEFHTAMAAIGKRSPEAAQSP